VDRIKQIIEKVKARVARLRGASAVLDIGLRTFERFSKDDGGSYAAALTYYVFFSIFPLLLALVTVLRFVLAGNEALQREILDSAARLVKPGGRLVYVTCSLLRQEDEEQVANFLHAHPDFVLVPIPSVWAEVIRKDCPVDTETLRLTPARNGTDGFFVAVIERRPVAE
jgi:SAM-dependent methyltransferase